MAYKVVKSTGSVHGLTRRKFIVDTAAEITDLPTNKKVGKKQDGDTVSDEMCAVGSIASVTATGDTYELNASGAWTLKPSEGSGSEGSDVTIDTTLSKSGQAADAKAVGDALKEKVESGDLDDYVKSVDAEDAYAKKSELVNYATTESLGSYMEATTADGKYATKEELGNYATTASLSGYVKTVDLPKGVAVSDATGTEDVVTQLNALIASLEAAGLLATS